MTLEETKKILDFLHGCYPAFYRNSSQQEARAVLTVWATLFSDEYYTYDMVLEAVKKYIVGRLTMRSGIRSHGAADETYQRFPPQPGVILKSLEYDKSVVYYARLLQAKRKRRRLKTNEREYLTEGGRDNG